MPVPQENSLFVEQTSCLFLRMVQDVSCIKQHRSFGVASIFLIDAIPLKYNALSSTGI
ncbi:hypothetical protein [Microcoleus vaginatus]|uniref:hypothetical protein n=1 Tax=Microcoleus vaginatus TaxID=119532 RepID=UPI001F620BF9